MIDPHPNQKGHNKIYESIVEKDKDECIKYINEHYDFAERQLKYCGSMI